MDRIPILEDFIKPKEIPEIARISGYSVNYIERFVEKKDRYLLIAIGKLIKPRTILGYAMISDDPFNKIAKIDSMLVLEQYRRQMVGTQMIERVLNFREKIQTIISDKNLTAHLFLKKVGFRGQLLNKESENIIFRNF